jgi:transcriptional regulator with XRE-family HTH domain
VVGFPGIYADATWSQDLSGWIRRARPACEPCADNSRKNQSTIDLPPMTAYAPGMESKASSPVAALRRQRKLSQLGLAQEAGVSQATISRLEKGERAPNLQVLAKIARALGVPIREIVEVAALEHLLVDEAPASVYAVCPNPFCERNQLTTSQEGKPRVIFSSGQSYPIDRREEVNFCAQCGTALAKECPSCGKLLQEKSAKFCVRCGTKIYERPTAEEWAKIEEILRSKESDDDIPF